jgi:cell division protein FtsI (penicillin-binding protein 3)
MSENLKNTVLRFAIVFAVITLLFVVVFVRIIVLQTAQRDKWEGVVNREDNYKPIKAIRGSIYDCEGRLLASSVPQYRIFMDTRVEALHMDKGDLFWDHVDSIANGLSRIVGDQTKEEYRKRMVDAYRRGKIVRLTNERISYTQLKEIKRLPLVCRGLYKSGFYAEDLNLRVKPFNSLGSRAIGNIYAASGEAKSGLEMRFDSYPRGEDGMSVRQKIAGGWQNVPICEAVHGCDV